MSDTKIYTAQEMRDTAQCLHYNSPTRLTIEAAAMLRQATDTQERCDKAVESMHTQLMYLANEGKTTVDTGRLSKYFAHLENILRGDAGKEGTMNNTKKANMDNTKNALAELAECIKNADIQIGRMAGCSFECIRKAQRIVAELAKVSLYESMYCKGSFTADVNTVDVILKCRAIAEEGGAE